MRVAVVGATTWGLTLGRLAAANGHAVMVVTRSEDEAARLRAHRRAPRLPELVLPHEMEVAAAGRLGAELQYVPELVIGAAPAQAMRPSLESCPAAWRSAPVVSAAKGLEQGSNLRMSQVLVRAGWAAPLVAVLSGPNLAKEVVAELPAAAVVASGSDGTAAAFQAALSRPTFRVYTSGDVVGVELAGAMKNVIAIAAGVATGLGFGANSVAAILTRGLAEMTRLGVALGAEMATFLGLAGVGDLAATCFSPLSRNRRLGELLAAGDGAQAAVAAIGEAVEGAATAPVIAAVAHAHGVEVPITEQVCRVLAGEVGVVEAMGRLLARELTSEHRR